VCKPAKDIKDLTGITDDSPVGVRHRKCVACCSQMETEKRELVYKG